MFKVLITSIGAFYIHDIAIDRFDGTIGKSASVNLFEHDIRTNDVVPISYKEIDKVSEKFVLGDLVCENQFIQFFCGHQLVLWNYVY